MECQICNKNPAAVHFKQVVNGETRELCICEACAAENGFNVESPMSMTDFLFGMGVGDKQGGKRQDKDCPVCRMPASEFRKSSRLGCPACYETFAEELLPYLSAMHKGTHHVGKLPAGQKVTAEIMAMQRALDQAVARQDFEEAATIRDRMGELKSAVPGVAGGGEGER